jgi:hypothetical protein
MLSIEHSLTWEMVWEIGMQGMELLLRAR